MYIYQNTTKILPKRKTKFLKMIEPNAFPGSSADIISVEFDGCTEKPCSVYHGTHATGRINLKANSATNTLTCKVS